MSNEREAVVKVIKKSADPLCVRISCGGDKVVGYYCVYRESGSGNGKHAIIECLESILVALKDNKHPVIDESGDLGFYMERAENR